MNKILDKKTDEIKKLEVSNNIKNNDKPINEKLYRFFLA
jgi:hypothetical protein